MNTHTPDSPYRLDRLSDTDLLASTRSLVGRSNQVLAALLAHLAEVEARGIHRVRACASLYTYCIYELRMSEDAAFRRARAAKIARRFPVLFEQIAAGELHLTAVLMLGPHLTEENHTELLARAKHRTKKEIARLVRMLDPVPDVPARVEPLGPTPTGVRAPTWDQFVGALSGPVRDGSFGPQRYMVRFTATEEYVQLLEQAKDLLPHAVPNRSIEQVHLRAMRAFVSELKRRRCASTDAPRGPRVGKAASSSERPQRRRHVTAAVRRAVWSRDGGRCAYVDATGQRCRETALLELHHDEAYARGGPPTEHNLSLRCRAHNALAAEEDFGRDFIALKRGTADPNAGSAPAPAR